MPMAPPLGLVATAGDQQVTLSWQASAGASTYTVFRSTSVDRDDASRRSRPTSARSHVRRHGPHQRHDVLLPRARRSRRAGRAACRRRSPRRRFRRRPPSAPANLTAKAGNARVDADVGSRWPAPPSYRVFRTTTDVFDATAVAKVTTPTFKNTGLTNGDDVLVPGRRATTPAATVRISAVVTATPVAPPPAPADVTATAGDHQVTIAWTPVAGATTYNVYPGTRPGTGDDAGRAGRRRPAVRRHDRRERADLLLQGHRDQRRRREPALGGGERHARGAAARRRRRRRPRRSACCARRRGARGRATSTTSRRSASTAFLDEQLAAPAVGLSRHAVQPADRDDAGALHAAWR